MDANAEAGGFSQIRKRETLDRGEDASRVEEDDTIERPRNSFAKANIAANPDCLGSG